MQITTRTSPSLDSSDFISDTSTASSVTTTNTVTSLSSTILSQASRRPSPNFDRVCSSPTRPSLSEYQQHDSARIAYKFLTPVSNTNTTRSSSPVSPFPSRTFSSPPPPPPPSPATSLTCPKGHEQPSSSSSSPMRSSLNQYAEFTSQTPTADTSREDMGPRTTTSTTATRTIMTMSMSPNRHHNQTRSAKAIITSAQISPSTNVTIMTNNGDGLKQHKQGDQKEL